MEKIFLVHNEREYTYKNLIDDLNSKEYYEPCVYIQDNDPYKIFLSIIHSIIYDYPIEVIDGDFSEFELKNMGINFNYLSISKKINHHLILDSSNSLINFIRQNKDWSLSLYTSGTTGRPKKMSHDFKTLTRNVKIHSKFQDNVWAFAYNPTHMAGIQVLFQGLMNQNTFIYIFGVQQKRLPNLIEKYKITNISATSTFYRNTVFYFNNIQFRSVKFVTFGGEKYDHNLEKKIKYVFPNTKIRNIYASTEAGSLFVAEGNVFNIPNSITDFVKINDENELLIHQSLLGSSSSLFLEDGWYRTGDIVEKLNANHFIFKSRKSEMINIGGYKVNPTEIENILVEIPGVIDLIVKSKKNSVTGQILVADVIKDKISSELELKKTIKKYASEHLQSWKIPRIIKFVESIPLTRTGKKVRK